jgi:hypothetical protein
VKKGGRRDVADARVEEEEEEEEEEDGQVDVGGYSYGYAAPGVYFASPGYDDGAPDLAALGCGTDLLLEHWEIQRGDDGRRGRDDGGGLDALDGSTHGGGVRSVRMSLFQSPPSSPATGAGEGGGGLASPPSKRDAPAPPGPWSAFTPPNSRRGSVDFLAETGRQQR